MSHVAYLHHAPRVANGVAKGVNVLVAEYHGFELLEQVSLQWFGKKPANMCNVGQWGIVTSSDLGPCRRAAILFQTNGTLVVLFQNICMYVVVPLGAHEHLHPNGVGEVIAGTNDLSFGGALGV